MRGWALALALLLGAAEAAALDLLVRSPRPGRPVFGPVEVEVEVLSERPVAAVEVRLDGELAGRLTEAPYRLSVDVGGENRPHTFEITAADVEGESVTRTVVTPAIEVHLDLDLELQQLYVTATRGRSRALDLDDGDFEVLDDGQPQALVTFERGDVPFTAVLLIDSSLSMEGAALETALAGARAFVAGMEELDEAKVMVFSDRLLAATPFTGDPEVVGSGLAGVAATGGTALNDHLYLALAELGARQGRRVIVLLSDGVDVESVLDMADVGWKAGRMQTLIYWIRPTAGLDPGDSYLSVWRDTETYRREIDGLERVVTGSGGRIREIEDLSEASGAFGEILDELREQYVLGYYSAEDRDDGAWHEVRVRVVAPGVEVRSRTGYFDDRF